MRNIVEMKKIYIKNAIKPFLMFILLMSSVRPIFAAQSLGIGDVATNMMEPVSLFSNFINTSCLILGVTFLLTSLLKYLEYRRTHMHISLGTIWFFFTTGTFLIILPLVSYLKARGM